MPSGAEYDINPRVEGGQAEVVTVADPSAGADFSYTLPDGYNYEVRSIAYQLVTSAAAANRNPGVKVTDGSDVELGRSFTTGATTATKTSQQNADIGFVGGGNSITDVAHIYSVPFGASRLPAGWKIKSVVNNIQAADQISNVRLTLVKRPN